MTLDLHLNYSFAGNVIDLVIHFEPIYQRKAPCLGDLLKKTKSIFLLFCVAVDFVGVVILQIVVSLN